MSSPFDPRELVARVRSILRRRQPRSRLGCQATSFCAFPELDLGLRLEHAARSRGRGACAGHGGVPPAQGLPGASAPDSHARATARAKGPVSDGSQHRCPDFAHSPQARIRSSQSQDHQDRLWRGPCSPPRSRGCNFQFHHREDIPDLLEQFGPRGHGIRRRDRRRRPGWLSTAIRLKQLASDAGSGLGVCLLEGLQARHTHPSRAR